jgi:hypothetical protein
MCPFPRCHASPFTGFDGRLANGGENQLHLSPPNGIPQLSCVAPTWANIVQDEACSRRPPQPPPSATSESISNDDFVALYERCVHTGLKARVALRYAAGRHEVSLTCYLPTF